MSLTFRLCFPKQQLEDVGTEYAPPKLAGNNFSGNRSSGFVVKGAPWEQSAPDTSNKEEFPSFGLPVASAVHSSSEATDEPAASSENGSSVWRR